MQIPSGAEGDQPPFELAPGTEAKVITYVRDFDNRDGSREGFFLRTLPLVGRAVPANIHCIVSVTGAKSVFVKVEPGLRDFLATGVVARGARRFNERAGIV
jgi:hypothetical protein